MPNAIVEHADEDDRLRRDRRRQQQVHVAARIDELYRSDQGDRDHHQQGEARATPLTPARISTCGSAGSSARTNGNRQRDEMHHDEEADQAADQQLVRACAPTSDAS